MATATSNEARLNFRLPGDLKRLIEQAAARTGQSVSDFAISTLVRSARTVLQESNATELSNRDRDIFLAALDDLDARPAQALVQAAGRYKKHASR